MNLDPITVGKVTMSFMTEGYEDGMIVAALRFEETGEVREQAIWQDGCKPLAPRWRETAERKMHKLDPDMMTPQYLIPSSMRFIPEASRPV